jgi:hypothetical protein
MKIKFVDGKNLRWGFQMTTEGVECRVWAEPRVLNLRRDRLRRRICQFCTEIVAFSATAAPAPVPWTLGLTPQTPLRRPKSSTGSQRQNNAFTDPNGNSGPA